MATFNRRLANGYCEYLGFSDEVRAFGIVDKDPYDPASVPFDDRNLARPIGFNWLRLGLGLGLGLDPNPNPSQALPIGFNWPSSCRVAELFEAKFLEKSAHEWEAELESAGLPCSVIQSWT